MFTASYLPSSQNNPYVKEACFRVTYSNCLQYKLSKCVTRRIDHLNRPMLKKLYQEFITFKKEIPGPVGFTDEFCQLFKGERIPRLYILF